MTTTRQLSVRQSRAATSLRWNDTHRTGLAPSPLCTFCKRVKGTAHHIYYHCKHEKLVAIRKSLTDGKHPDKAASFFQMAYTAADWKPQWTQALRPDPSFRWAPQAHEEHIFWDGDLELQGMFQGYGATDGAALRNHLEPIRLCGWAAVLCSATGAMLAVTYGTLPFPVPTILLAELWGFFQYMRQSVAGAVIGVDNKQLFDGLLRGGNLLHCWGQMLPAHLANDIPRAR
jgi:hypothetical protein